MRAVLLEPNGHNSHEHSLRRGAYAHTTVLPAPVKCPCDPVNWYSVRWQAAAAPVLDPVCTKVGPRFRAEEPGTPSSDAPPAVRRSSVRVANTANPSLYSD